jgi:hypothetical protein
MSLRPLATTKCHYHKSSFPIAVRKIARKLKFARRRCRRGRVEKILIEINVASPPPELQLDGLFFPLLGSHQPHEAETRK